MKNPHGATAKIREEEDAIRHCDLSLDIKGLTYRKRGGPQRAKRGDWLVDNDAVVYSVDGRVVAHPQAFACRVLPEGNTRLGRSGDARSVVKTKEGGSRYRRGDFLVSNRKNGSDSYCMSRS